MSADLRLVRHATLQLHLGGQRLLIDPMLDPAGARPAVVNTANDRRNPLVELPEPAEAIVDAADVVLVTHLHTDHVDAAAASLVAGRLPVFCQPGDREALREQGLVQADEVADRVTWNGLAIARTGGRHGTGEIADQLGPVSGFVVSDGETSVYVAGDTVWCEPVAGALAEHRPDVIVVNAGGARFTVGDPITMTARDVLAVREAASDATIVAVHLEAINHCLETRAELAAATRDARVLIPEDGETMTFQGGVR